MKLPRSVKLYLGFICTLGFALLAVSVLKSDIHDADNSVLAAAIFFMLLGAIMESLPVRLAGDNLITISSTVSIAAILLFDVQTAVIIRFFAAILAIRKTRTRYTHLFNTEIYKSLFNGFARGITVFIAGLTYSAISVLVPHYRLFNFNILGFVGLLIVYFSVDLFLFSVLFSLLSRSRLHDEINKKLWTVSQLILLSPIGVLFAGLYNWQGIFPIVLLCGPFFFARHSLEQGVQTRQTFQEITTLYEALSKISGKPGNVKMLAKRITEIVVNDFHAQECDVWLLSDDGSRIIRKAHGGQDATEEEDFLLIEETGVITSAIKEGKSIYVPDVRREPCYHMGDETTLSEFVVPLQAYGEIIGVLNLESPRLDDFSEQTRRLILAFSQNATLAIQNAKLVTSLEANLDTLKESQARINFFLEHTAEGVYRIDYDPPIPIDLSIEEQFKRSVEHGRIAECNTAFANMYGASTREEMIGKPYIEFYGGEGYEANMEGNLEFMRQGYKIDDLETEEFNTKGEKVYFTNNVVGIIRDGYFVSTWGTQRDITPLKKALAELEKNLAELKESQARINYFLEHTNEGVYRIDYDPPIPTSLSFEEQYKLSRECGKFGECNLAIAKMYGYSSREEMLAAPYYVENEGYEASFKANVEFYKRGYKSDDFETEEFTPGGEKVYFLNNAIGIVRDGSFMSIWGTQRDITPLKKALAELENRNAELERFNYTLSHELKTPIVTIRGFLGYLENSIATGSAERAKADLLRIGAAADKMHKMINELIELSRIGRIINPPEDVAFEEIVQAGLNNAKEVIQERNIQVRVHSNLPVVHVDLARMIEVVQNLVENAVKYMGDQSNPQITIGVRSEKAERVFFISDNGIGIDPSYHERVFNIFEKLDPQSPGTGIGLALAKRIIETHGGKIWVESDGIGKGSDFCFTLPGTAL